MRALPPLAIPPESGFQPGNPFARHSLNRHGLSGLAWGETISTRELLDLAEATREMAPPEAHEALLAIVGAPALAPGSRHDEEPLKNLATCVRAAGGWTTGLVFEVTFEPDTGRTHLRPSPQHTLEMSGLCPAAVRHQRGHASRDLLCGDGKGVWLSRGLFFAEEREEGGARHGDGDGDGDGDGLDPQLVRELGQTRWHAIFCPLPLLEAMQRTVFFQAAPLWLEMLAAEWRALLREYQPLLRQRLTLEAQGLTAPMSAPMQSVELRLLATGNAWRSLRHAHGHTMRVATARGESGYLVQDESLIQYSLMCDPRTPLTPPAAPPDAAASLQDLPMIPCWYPVGITAYPAASSVEACLYRLDLRDFTQDTLEELEFPEALDDAMPPDRESSQALRDFDNLMHELFRDHHRHAPPNDGFDGAWRPRGWPARNWSGWREAPHLSQTHELMAQGHLCVGRRIVPFWRGDEGMGRMWRGYALDFAEMSRQHALAQTDNAVFDLGLASVDGRLDDGPVDGPVEPHEPQVLAWGRALVVQATQWALLPLSAASHNEAVCLYRLLPRQWTRMFHVPQISDCTINGKSIEPCAGSPSGFQLA